MEGVTVTNGSVSYNRMARPADFENKTPGVQLTYIVNEGVDPEKATQYVMGIAFRTVEAVHRTGQQPPMQQPNRAVAQEIVEKNDQPPTPASTGSALSEQGSVDASGSASNEDAGGPVADTAGGVVKRRRRTAAQIAEDNAKENPTPPPVATVDGAGSLTDMLGPNPAVKTYTFDDVYKVVATAVQRLTDAGKPGDELYAALKEAGAAEGRLAGVPQSNWPKVVELVEKIGR